MDGYTSIIHDVVSIDEECCPTVKRSSIKIVELRTIFCETKNRQFFTVWLHYIYGSNLRPAIHHFYHRLTITRRLTKCVRCENVQAQNVRGERFVFVGFSFACTISYDSCDAVRFVLHVC